MKVQNWPFPILHGQPLKPLTLLSKLQKRADLEIARSRRRALNDHSYIDSRYIRTKKKEILSADAANVDQLLY